MESQINSVPRVLNKELVEELGLHPGLLAPSSGLSYCLHSLGPVKSHGGHSALEWCSPRPTSPPCPGSTALIPCQKSLVAQLVGRSQAWQPLVGIQVELLFPVPSLAHSMASSSKYVLPDSPQLLAGGALGGRRELGANWAQPT